MIGRLVTSNPARRARECYYYNQGRRPDEPGVDLDELPLGRISTSDWSCNRVLDRMLMYERRIENSLHKNLRELERQKLIRQVEQQYAEQELSVPEIHPASEQKDDLKKQTQFVPTMIGLTPFIKGFYGVGSTACDEENKAKQSQTNPNSVSRQTCAGG